MIGKHQPHDAKNIGHRGLLEAMIDEVFTALEESIVGLSDEQFWAYPLTDKHNAVTLVEHCLQSLDMYLIEVFGHELTYEAEKRFDIWHHSAEELRPEMTNLPTVADALHRLTAVRARALETVRGLTDEQLTAICPSWIGEEYHKTGIDVIWRAVAHVQTHIRQIWYMRGRAGMPESAGWPQQHWA